jgi:hypothetical protein
LGAVFETGNKVDRALRAVIALDKHADIAGSANDHPAARIERHAENFIGEFGIGELRDFKAIWNTQTGEFTTKAQGTQS